MDPEQSIHAYDVFCENSDHLGSAEVFKRRGGWFTVEVMPFMIKTTEKLRKGFRDEVAARDYAFGLAQRFMSEAVAHANAEWPEEDNEASHHIQYAEYGIIQNGPHY